MGAAGPLPSPSVSRRSLRSSGTSRTASGSLCAGGGDLSSHSGPLLHPGQVWCAQRHSPGGQHPSIRDDILHDTCWHPPARSDGAKSEGPIYHSHSRKINLHLILNFPVLTFKAIEQIRTPQLFHSTQYFIPGKKQRMKTVFYSPPINWGGGGVGWLRVTKYLLLNLGSCVWKAAVMHETNCPHPFQNPLPSELCPQF